MAEVEEDLLVLMGVIGEVEEEDLLVLTGVIGVEDFLVLMGVIGVEDFLLVFETRTILRVTRAIIS